MAPMPLSSYDLGMRTFLSLNHALHCYVPEIWCLGHMSLSLSAQTFIRPCEPANYAYILVRSVPACDLFDGMTHHVKQSKDGHRPLILMTNWAQPGMYIYARLWSHKRLTQIYILLHIAVKTCHVICVLGCHVFIFFYWWKSNSTWPELFISCIT